MIEHTILHVLITQETAREFGAPGYDAYLRPMIEEWYLEEVLPRPEWMKNCHHKSFLKPEETVNVLKKMEEKIGNSYHNTPFDYHEAKRKKIEEFKELKKAREKEWEESTEKYRERERQMQKKKIGDYYFTYL